MVIHTLLEQNWVDRKTLFAWKLDSFYLAINPLQPKHTIDFPLIFALDFQINNFGKNTLSGALTTA